MLAICGCWDQASGVPAPRAAAAQAGLLVSYRPLAGLTSGVLRAFHGPRQASAEVSRAAAGAVATRSEERTPPTRARPFVVGATNKTPLPRGFRGLCFDHCYYGRFCGPIPRFNFLPRHQQRFNFFFVWPATSLHLSSRYMLPQAAALMRL